MRTVDTKHLETKSDAKREAEAIARLREAQKHRQVNFVSAQKHVLVEADDLRALLDAYTEALDALEALEDACASVASWSEECLEFNDPTRAAVRAVLTKSGRR